MRKAWVAAVACKASECGQHTRRARDATTLHLSPSSCCHVAQPELSTHMPRPALYPPRRDTCPGRAGRRLHFEVRRDDPNTGEAGTEAREPVRHPAGDGGDDAVGIR